MKVYFIRHPETTWNVKRLFQGSKEGEISKAGKLATIEFVEKIKNINIDVIYSANNKRSTYLANMIAKYNTDIEVVKDIRINERSFGLLEGESVSERAKDPGYKIFDENKRFNWEPPQGESLKKVSVRVKSFLDYIKTKHDKNETIFVVTSGGVIKVALYILKIKTLKEAMECKIKNLELFESNI